MQADNDFGAVEGRLPSTLSKAIRAFAAMVAGAIFGLAMLIWIGATLADMILTGLFTAGQASDGVAWEGPISTISTGQ